MSEKIYRVQMNNKGMPNFATAVEIADRPQGEWTYHMDEVGNVKTISCALCGGWVDITIPEQTAEFAYCPYCGARMKGAEDE